MFHPLIIVKKHSILFHRGDDMNASKWIKDTPKTSYPKIEQDVYIDTLIIGAGLTGLTTGYYLSQAMKQFIIVEADCIGYGASGRNTCKLTAQHGLIYKSLIQKYGYTLAKQYYDAHMEAIESIEEIVHKHQIDCDFKRCNSVLFTQESEKVPNLQDEYQACIDLNIPCSFIDTVQYPLTIQAGIMFPEQAKFHPLKYMIALADILTKKEIAIYEHSPVTNIIEENGTYIALCNHRKIYARNIVQATQFPFYDQHQFLFAKTYPMSSSILCTPTTANYGDDMLINTESPSISLHAFSIQGQTCLMVGGNSHKTGQFAKEDPDYVQRAKKMFGIEHFEDMWSTQDYMTFDHLPYIGKLQKNNDQLYIATGYCKWGNTTSNIAGKLLCAYLLKQPSPYRKLFDPHRLSSLFSLTFLKENMNVAYEFVKGKLQPCDKEYPQKGQARVIEIQNHLYGVYRDEQDELYIVDITCPHLGCICIFNQQDKTWDCPCHGSRYSYTGEVIKGPSTNRLHSYREGRNQIDPHLF